jgi:ABC-type amino acid transport substrate-binding protein
MRKNPYKIGRAADGAASPRPGRLTLKGREGRIPRIVLISLGALILLILIASLMKPETQLMSSVEIKRIENKGILTVGVRDDMPGFCEKGEGFEAELARLLAKRILPDSDEALSLEVCTVKTVSAKLSDGSIDVAIALQPEGSGSAYSYSYPYFTDNVRLVTLSEELSKKEPWELVIGYIPETAAGSRFTSYVSRVTASEEQNLIEKLLRKPKPTPDPAAAVTIESKKYGSYDELVAALKRGDVDAAALSGAYIYRYFIAGAEENEISGCWLCEADIGVLKYCVIASSDEPALTQIADMLIYEIGESGLLRELTNKYLADVP